MFKSLIKSIIKQANEELLNEYDLLREQVESLERGSLLDSEHLNKLMKSNERLISENTRLRKDNNAHAGDITQVYELVESSYLKDLLLTNDKLDMQKVNNLFSLLVKHQYPPAK
jgi:hypothetical protein